MFPMRLRSVRQPAVVMRTVALPRTIGVGVGDSRGEQARGKGHAGVRVGSEERCQAHADCQTQSFPTHVPWSPSSVLSLAIPRILLLFTI